MQSQIGQVSTGQNPTPLSPATGKDGGDNPKRDAQARDTFQSILAGTFLSARKMQDGSTENAQKVAEAETSASSEDDIDLPMTSDDSDSDVLDEIAAAGTDTQTNAEEPASDEPDTDLELMPQPQENTPEELDASAPRVSDNLSSRSEGQSAPTKSAVPAWFVTARSDAAVPTIDRTATADTPAIKQGASEAAEPISPVSPVTATTPVVTQPDGVDRQQSDTASKRAPATPGTAVLGEAAGQHAKQALVVDNRSPVAAIPTVPGQVAGKDAEPRRALDRTVAREDQNTVISSQNTRTPGAAAPVAPITPLSATVARGDDAAGKSNTRWLSELGFTSETAAAEVHTPTRAQQNSLLQQPDLPRNIAAQIAQAMQNGRADRPMELVLSPAELGRVRISMQAGDGGMTVQVIADRLETLDLMRRHADLLAQELHDIGFDTASFAFGQGTADSNPGDGGGATGHENQAKNATGDDTNNQEPVPQTRLALHSDRVDIRL